jgi:hypothetical protein
MGGKYPGQRNFFIFAGVNLQNLALVGLIIFMKPKKYLDMRKTLQPQKRIRIGFRYFNPGLPTTPTGKT